MQDTKLFETIVGITTPWHVARVTLKPEDERVDVVAGARADALALSRLRRDGARLRSCGRADVAPSRHVSVSDAPACQDSAGAVSGPWREASAGAVGRAAEPLHSVAGGG